MSRQSDASAVELASKQLAESLRTPHDLENLPKIRELYLRDQLYADEQLQSQIEIELGRIQSGVDCLNVGQTAVLEISGQLENVDRIASMSDMAITDIDVIQRAARLYNNFCDTQRMVNHFQTMHTELEDVEQLMADDGDLDLKNERPNMFVIHYSLMRLRKFRDEALYQSRDNQDIRQTLTRYFERMDGVVSQFENTFWTLSGHILDLVKENNFTLTVKIAKIIAAEELEDDKSLAMQQARTMYKELSHNLQSIQVGPHKIQSYRKKFEKSVDESLQKLFSRYIEVKGDDPKRLLEGLDWVYNDLIIVRDELTSCFPASWNLFELFVQKYHYRLYDLLRTLVNSGPDAATLLTILEWVKIYKSTMTQEVNFPFDKLEPKLLDGKEDALIDDYLKIIVQKVEEWIDNLMNTEIKDFTERTEAPEQSAEGTYGMHGGVIMFEMVSQQIDVAAESGQAKVLMAVVKECTRVIKNCHVRWIQILQNEIRKQCETPEVIAGGLVEYTVALANDHIRAGNYITGISDRITPIVSKTYQKQIAEEFDSAVNGALDVADQSILSLLDLIFNDVKQPFSLIFTPVWYSNGNAEIKSIFETFAEYVQDCRSTLDELLWDLFTERLVRYFVLKYLSALRNKNARLKIPAASEQMTQDIKLSYSYFRDWHDEKDTDEQYRALQLSKDLLSCSPDAFVTIYGTFLNTYWDAPSWLIEVLIKNRDDLDKSNIKSMLETAKLMRKNLPKDQPTLLGELK